MPEIASYLDQMHNPSNNRDNNSECTQRTLWLVLGSHGLVHDVIPAKVRKVYIYRL